MRAGKRFGVLIGTRPGIVKMAPVFHELSAMGQCVDLIHTGQHYSPNMDRDIMNAVGLPDTSLRAIRPESCVSHAQTTAYMLTALEDILQKANIECLLVCGDANTNLAGALAARKLGVEVGHVESGLRSRDWRMPEEHNRVMIDHISDYLFAPSQECVDNLKAESVCGQVLLTGNTIVDATFRALRKIREDKVADIFSSTSAKRVLFTAHREENVDRVEVLGSLVKSLVDVASATESEVVWPVHPRTLKRLREFNLIDLMAHSENIRLIEPQGYLEFICAQRSADIVVTDSGGVQEECCILGTPCVTVRRTTERPETIAIGANHLCDPETGDLTEILLGLLVDGRSDWPNPYGDGSAAKLIARAVVGNSK